jgi:hypothetical protein
MYLGMYVYTVYMGMYTLPYVPQSLQPSSSLSYIHFGKMKTLLTVFHTRIHNHVLRKGLSTYLHETGKDMDSLTVTVTAPEASFFKGEFAPTRQARAYATVAFS